MITYFYYYNNLNPIWIIPNKTYVFGTSEYINYFWEGAEVVYIYDSFVHY